MNAKRTVLASISNAIGCCCSGDGSIVFAQLDNNTLSRSTNSGVSFTSSYLTSVDPLPSYLGYGNPMIWLPSTNIVLMGALNASTFKLYRSTDSGTNFNQSTISAWASSFARNASVILLSGKNTSNQVVVLKSTDSGASWSSSLFTGPTNVEQSLLSYTPFTNGFLLGLSNGSMYYGAGANPSSFSLVKSDGISYSPSFDSSNTFAIALSYTGGVLNIAKTNDCSTFVSLDTSLTLVRHIWYSKLFDRFLISGYADGIEVLHSVSSFNDTSTVHENNLSEFGYGLINRVIQDPNSYSGPSAYEYWFTDNRLLKIEKILPNNKISTIV